MINIVIFLAFIILIPCYALAGYRILKGPTLFDRILAFDGIQVATVIALILISMKTKSVVFIDIIMIVSLLGFISPVAFLNYIHNKGGE